MKKNIDKKGQRIGIIILAAGASRRMGTPKQLLKINHQTLIERAINLTSYLENQQTLVVLGANAALIQPFIKKSKTVDFIINKDWQRGMGTTLQTGINYFLEKNENITAVIIMVCDQPYLTTEKLKEIINTYQNRNVDIVASKYGGILGVPALFSNNLFSKLTKLKKDEGARKIIKNNKEEIAVVDFPEGIIDLDTPTAYQEFLKNSANSTK